MEEVGGLFDSCDERFLGKVPVSKLISALKNAINTSDNDPKQQAKEEILMATRLLLDPLDQDVHIDKATWLAAWQRQAEGPSPQKVQENAIRNMEGGDDFGLMDESSEGQGALDQSKHSYCFSPSSRSSSVENEPEEVILLKEENQQLLTSIKKLKQQLQKQEDALLLEQADKQELEKSLKDSINGLSKQYKCLLETNEELKLSLEACEREKLDLCSAGAVQNLTEKQLRGELSDLNKVIAALNAEIEELNEEREQYKLRILELQTVLEQQANIHQDQVKGFQETIQNCIVEKDELSSRITRSVLDKRDLAARLEESEFTSLESELAVLDFQAEDVHSDSFSSDIDTLSNPNVLAANQLNSVSTSYMSVLKPAELGSSLLEELQAVGSFLYSGNELDSINDSESSGETPGVLQNSNRVTEDDKNGLPEQQGPNRVIEDDTKSLPEEHGRNRVVEDDAKKLPELRGPHFVIEDDTKSLPEEHGRNRVIEDDAKKLPEQQESNMVIEAEQQGPNRVIEDSAKKLPELQEPNFVIEDDTKSLPEQHGRNRVIEDDAKKLSEQQESNMVIEDDAKNSTEQQEPIMGFEDGEKELSEHQENKTIAREKPSFKFVLTGDLTLHPHLQNLVKTQSDIFICSKDHPDDQILTPVITLIGPTTEILPVKPCDRNIVNTDMEEPTYTCSIDPPKKPMSLKPSDIRKNAQSQTCADHVTSSTRYRISFAVIFTCLLFFLLLIFSTILCTSAVLEYASETGVLSHPFYGSTPSWIKRILKPLVAIHPPKDLPM